MSMKTILEGLWWKSAFVTNFHRNRTCMRTTEQTVFIWRCLIFSDLISKTHYFSFALDLLMILILQNSLSSTKLFLMSSTETLQNYLTIS